MTLKKGGRKQAFVYIMGCIGVAILVRSLAHGHDDRNVIFGWVDPASVLRMSAAVMGVF